MTDREILIYFIRSDKNVLSVIYNLYKYPSKMGSYLNIMLGCSVFHIEIDN